MLYQLVHNNWATKCDIHLCSKGFFMVFFDKPTDYKKVTENGPWFQGRAGCFITTWIADFDPAYAPITITPIQVRLLNLPLHFCGIVALSEIGNALGKLVAIDYDRIAKGFQTYARICVEVDLSAWLPDQITLNWNSNRGYKSQTTKIQLSDVDCPNKHDTYKAHALWTDNP